MTAVAKGQKIKFCCTSFLDDGTSLDDPEDNEPMVMEAGLTEGNSVAIAISKALVGMKFGETKTIKLPSKNAFGEIEEDKVIQIPRSSIPSKLNVGDMVQAQSKSGDVDEAIVRQVDDENIVLDFNHPLAGQDLTFEIHVLDKKDQ